MEAPSRKRKRRDQRRAPAITVEDRENQLISLAVDLAEKQLAEGIASAQVITHFLKLGTIRARLEMEKLKQENELLGAKTEALQSAKTVEALYRKALKAMREYQGVEDESEVMDE